jgi:TonB family protein
LAQPSAIARASGTGDERNGFIRNVDRNFIAPGDPQGVCIYITQDEKQLRGQISYRNDTKLSSLQGSLGEDTIDLVMSDGASAKLTLRLTPLDAVLTGSASIAGASESITLKKYVTPAQYYRFGKGRIDPVPIRTSMPEYTPKAREARLQGTDSLSVPIESSGAVGPNVTVLSGLGLGLDDEAIKCVRRWLFSPPDYQCNPTPLQRRIDIHFKLPD